MDYVSEIVNVLVSESFCSLNLKQVSKILESYQDQSSLLKYCDKLMYLIFDKCNYNPVKDHSNNPNVISILQKLCEIADKYLAQDLNKHQGTEWHGGLRNDKDNDNTTNERIMFISLCSNFLLGNNQKCVNILEKFEKVYENRRELINKLSNQDERFLSILTILTELNAIIHDSSIFFVPGVFLEMLNSIKFDEYTIMDWLIDDVVALSCFLRLIKLCNTSVGEKFKSYQPCSGKPSEEVNWVEVESVEKPKVELKIIQKFEGFEESKEFQFSGKEKIRVISTNDTDDSDDDLSYFDQFVDCIDSLNDLVISFVNNGTLPNSALILSKHFVKFLHLYKE